MQAEVCDWRRFARAASIMGFVGLVPSEYSAGAPPAGGISPKPATPTCGPSWWSPPGPTSTAPMSARDRQTPGRAAARGGRPGLGGAAAPVRTVPSPGGPQEHQERGRRRGGPGARRVPVGRDDRPEPMTVFPSGVTAGWPGVRDLHDAPAYRRCRTDPRRHYAAAKPRRS